MSFRILQYLLEKRKVIGWVTLLPALAAMVFLIFADAGYRSETMLMPPLEEGSEGLLSAWMAQLNLPSMVVPMAASSLTAAVLVDILESRRLAEIVIEQQDLKAWYETDSSDEMVRELRSNTSISASSTGMITLKVTDRDPEKARAITYAYITGLDTLNRQLIYTRAENTMRFVSGQIEKYRTRLEVSRGRIADFQRENGIIDFDEQIRGAVDVAAVLKVKAVLAEIELDLVREFAAEGSSELKRREIEYENLTAQLEKIVKGDTSSAVFVSMADMPGLYQQYASLQRDLEVDQRVYSFLVERYEDSGIDRARNTPSVQIVDAPSFPEKRAGVPPWGIVLISAAAGFFWICLVLSWWVWISTRERDEKEEAAFRDVTGRFSKDIESVRKRLKL